MRRKEIHANMILQQKLPTFTTMTVFPCLKPTSTAIAGDKKQRDKESKGPNTWGNFSPAAGGRKRGRECFEEEARSVEYRKCLVKSDKEVINMVYLKYTSK